MSSDFDPIRAQRELVAAALGVLNVIKSRAAEAERKIGEAEADLNALRKLEAFAQEKANEERARLNALVAAQKGAA